MLQGLTVLGAGLAMPGGVHDAPGRAGTRGREGQGARPARSPSWTRTSSRPCRACARCIVPGSDKAGADRFIDELLAVAGTERQRKFLTAFGAIEGAALERFQKPFKALTEPQQIEILTVASTGPSGGRDWTWEPGKLFERPNGRRRDARRCATTSTS